MRHTPKFITDICSIPKQPWFDIFNFIENNRLPSFRGAELQYYICFQKYDQSSLLNDLIALTAPKCGKNLKTAETNHFPNFWVSDLENCNVFFSFLKFHVIKSRRSSHIWKPSKNYQKLKPLKLQWKLHTIPNFRALNSSQFLEL